MPSVDRGEHFFDITLKLGPGIEVNSDKELTEVCKIEELDRSGGLERRFRDRIKE